MKIVKSGSRPLDDAEDFQKIKALAGLQEWMNPSSTGQTKDIAAEARARYVDRILGFVSVARLAPLKIVINSGNGAAGPTLDAIIDRLAKQGAPIGFVRVHHEPDSTFPNGIPNPLLPQNHAATADVVLREGADIGVAFDGDFDRCFFFDGTGQFVPGEYVVGLLGAGIRKTLWSARVVLQYSQRLGMHSLSTPCVRSERFMAVRCPHTITSVNLPIAIVA